MVPIMEQRTQNNSQYDVIIVGGRPAGATLAARLGQQGISVLLVDRATFPSLPPVSSPVIYACTMAMLDEIGADEAEYARATPRIHKVATEARDYYRGVGQIPMDRGRDYAYAVDRARFDDALWRHAASFPSVTVYQEFGVLDLLWEGDKVVGVVGKPHGEQAQPYYADVVIGADGKQSVVARKVEAPIYNEIKGIPVSYYYAYWKNVSAYDIDEPLLLTHGTLDGHGYLIMSSAEGTTAVTIGGYTENFENIPHESVEDLYLKVLRKAPRIWDRLKNAERVTSVRGLKNVPNYYRQPGGGGWALVGDAAHHKDPLGGQGIYDAVFGARAFAAEYLAYYRGEIPWETTIIRYKQALEAETLDMYRNTTAATSNYGPSNALMQTVARYACENPEFIGRMLRVPTRTLPPTDVVGAPLLAQTLVKGVTSDVRRAVTGEYSPAHVPPLPGNTADKNDVRLGCLGWMLLLPFLMAANGLRLRPGSRRS